MRSENEVRNRVKKFLDVVINPSDGIDDFEYEGARFRLDALLWVLEEFDHIPVSGSPVADNRA